MSQMTAFDNRLDQLISLDLGGRGVEQLFASAREQIGQPLVGAAADALLALKPGDNVIVTTGSVSRARLSPTIGENDGPAGLAAIVRALVLARNVTCTVLIEETLRGPMEAILTEVGLTVLPYWQAVQATKDKSLATVCVESFPVTDEEAPKAARELLNARQPALLFSTERVGRNKMVFTTVCAVSTTAWSVRALILCLMKRFIAVFRRWRWATVAMKSAWDWSKMRCSRP